MHTKVYMVLITDTIFKIFVSMSVYLFRLSSEPISKAISLVDSWRYYNGSNLATIVKKKE